jgi:Ca-activated chloride channel family protein
MEHFHFLRPGWLLLLPLVVGLVWAVVRRNDAYHKWREFLAPHLLEVLLVDRRGSKRIRPITLLAVVLTLGIVALAGPTWRQQPLPFTQDTASLVIVLKVTPSMLTGDVQPSRLERAAHKIKDLLVKRAGLSAALVAYAGSAHLVMPLTRDANIINSFATELHPDMMPQHGDDPIAALTLAAKQLLGAKEKGAILWIGDALTADAATHIAAQGKRSLASLIMLGAVGLDPDSTEREELQQAASVLGVRFEFIAPDDRDIDAIAAYVEADLTSVLETEAGTQWQDEGYWLLFPIIVLALFWFRAGWLMKYQ